MRDLFDPNVVALIVPDQDRCSGCQREWSAITYGSEPLPGGMGLELRRDYRTLGLKTAGVPEVVELCPDCAHSYMNEFNRLNAKRRGQNN